MTELVRKFPTPQFIGAQLFPEKSIISNTAEWDEIHQNRDIASYTNPDAEANIVDRRGVLHKTATVATIREKKNLSGSTMAWLRRPGTENTQYGEEAVRDELAELNNRIERRRELSRWQALTGTLTVDEAGTKFTVDYGIAVAHKPTVGTTWSDVSADIITDLNDWKKLIREDSGEEPTTVYLHETVMGHMIRNTGIQALMGEQLKTQILQNGYITKVLNLTFVVYSAGYVPSGGSFTPFIDEAYIIMTTGSKFGMELVAPSIDPKSGFRPGKFSKSYQQEDPAGVTVLVEVNSLPVITKVENIVYAKVIL
jgi:hypothetical protein